MNQAFNKKSLRAAFFKEACRLTLALALTGAFSAALRPVFAQTPAVADNDTAETGAISGSPALKPEQQRQAINDALLRQGNKQFTGLLACVPDSYSCFLEDLETDLNGRLQAHTPSPNLRVVILDPLTFDVGLALNIKSADVISRMLLAKGITPTEDLINRAGQLMGREQISVTGNKTYNSNPTAIPEVTDSYGIKVRIVIPAAGYVSISRIPGISTEEIAQLITRHEGWHAIDLRNDQSGIDSSGLDAAAPQTIDQKLNTPDYLRLSSVLYNTESYADVGSLGDMIRTGHSMALIDFIIAERLEHPADTEHMSPPVLEELKKEINRMEVDNFRKLNNEQAEEFYNSVMDKAGLTPERLAFVYKYVQLTLEAREDFALKNKDNPDFKVALKYIGCFVTSDLIDILSLRTVEPGVDESAAKKRSIAKINVDSWDAQTELQKQALTADGKITPATYTKAYAVLMQKYGALLNAAGNQTGGANTEEQQLMLEGKISKLKTTFLNVTAATDYVAVNQKYGVDITKADIVHQYRLVGNEPRPIQ